MKQISFWAQQHPFLTRFLFVVIYILLNATAYLLGVLLQSGDVYIPFVYSYILLLPFLTTLFLYPSRKLKASYKNFYRSQKTADFLLATCSFLFVVIFSNQEKPKLFGTQNQVAATMQAPAVVKDEPKKKKISIHLGRQGFIKQQWQKIKHQLRELRTELRKTSKFGKALLIALTVVVGAALLLLVAGLSCELSCSGAEGLAFTVLLLGGGLVIFLMVLVIQRIHRGPKNKKPDPAAGGDTGTSG